MPAFDTVTSWGAFPAPTGTALKKLESNPCSFDDGKSSGRFRVSERTSPLLDLIGPFAEAERDGATVLGLWAEERHTNSRVQCTVRF